VGRGHGRGRAAGLREQSRPADYPGERDACVIRFRSTFLDDVGRLDQLPSLPTIVTQLMEVIDDPLASALDVAHILREDPPLTARVLRMANSALYGGRTRIMSVPQAVLRLGMLEIRNVVVSLTLINAMARFGRRLNYRSFWHHSLTVALATETLTRLVPAEDVTDDDGAFATGLLHDIGRLLLDQFYPQAYDEAARVAEEQKIPLIDAERRTLEMDHAEIGALLAGRWSLPEPIVRGIRYHHTPDDAPPSGRRIAGLVRLAEQVCAANELGDPLEGEPAADPVAALARLGVGADRSAGVIQATVASAKKSAVLLVLSR
jgi:putative nucleotidyltransferase with HDIG domain